MPRLAQGRGQVQVRRRGVDRVAVEDDHGVDAAGAQVCRQVLDGAEVRRRHGQEGDGLPHVAQGHVQGVDQGVHRRGLAHAGQQQAPAPVGHQVAGHRAQVGAAGGVPVPARELAAGDPRTQGQGQALAQHQLGRQRPHRRADVPGRGGEAVVGHAAGGGEGVLPAVEAVHVPGLGPPAGRELAAVAQGRGVVLQQVRVEVDDDRGPLEVQLRQGRLPEGLRDAHDLVPAADRLPHVGAGAGVGLGGALQQPAHRGRAGGAGQDGQTGAVGAQAGEVLPGPAAEGGPVGLGRGAALARDHLAAAVGVVQVQHAGLGDGGGGAAAQPQPGVAVDLDGPAVVAGGQDAVGHRAQLEGGGELRRRAGHVAGGTLGEGHDLLDRPAAARQAGQGHRGRHDLQEAPAAHAAGSLDARGELVVQLLPELVGVRQLLQAPPVVLAPDRDVRDIGHARHLP